jgi:hypothetical protein
MSMHWTYSTYALNFTYARDTKCKKTQNTSDMRISTFARDKIDPRRNTENKEQGCTHLNH